MKKIITTEEYAEYERLKRWAKEESIYLSSQSIENLCDDIDLPVRKCVAMLALLNYEPIYSCCGFDYAGQPLHKSHQYGEPYFMLKLKSHCPLETIDLVYWQTRRTKLSIIIELKEIIREAMNPHWREITCPHFAEEIIIAITHFERVLLSNYDNFVTEVTIKDTNQLAKDYTEYWQYIPKKDWVVRKEDIHHH